MSQNLLTKKKQENVYYVHVANLIKPMQTVRNRYTFCVIKSLEHLKNLKTDRLPYLGLELTMHLHNSQIYLVRQSL